MWVPVYIVVLLLVALPAKGRTVCDADGTIRKAGYPAEKYDVITKDGYILEVNRIPNGKNSVSKGRRPVIFLMHGLLASANSYVALGAKDAIGFNLADAGFDVWLGTARAVCNSRRHISLNPDNKKDKAAFFDFTWEEIALYDLPAMIEFVLEKTGQEKLHYIGHSQGGAAFMVLNSMKPEYNEKFISAHLLAAVGYQSNFPNTKLRMISSFTNPLYSLAQAVGLLEVNYQWIINDNSSSVINLEIFKEIIETVSVEDLGATAAIKQFAHFGQNIKDGKFRRWNYSPLQNLFIYGSLTPPKYDLSNINVDITMHYTVGDSLLDEKDVLAMVGDLPRARARKVPKPDFSHLDFVRCSYVKPLVTDYIVNDLLSR